jgi:formate hydrogenlyase subunit 4
LIFSITPYVVFSSSIAALLIVPLALPDVSANRLGDALALIFILSTGRFFQSLAGLDAGSSFGGMGSSREMFISSFAEPAALLALFAVGFNNGSTSLGVISRSQFISISSIIASAALFLVAIAETSRIPVDNQETHLELTMVHEAMVLEYSGRSLALIELSSYIKQMVFFSLIAAITFPPAVIPSIGWMSAAVYICAYAVKIAAIAVIVAFLEVSVAKMRLFRVVDFLSFAFMLSCMAVVTSLLRL